jgi:TolB protein
VKNASPSSPETKLLDGAWDVAYSPDGSRIAFVRESPGPEIFVVGADGKGTPTKLTSNTVVDDNPAWSPDGTQIVYESGIHIW